MSTTALDILNRIYGYPTFRGHQAEIIEHVAGGGDALVLMPTGGGKSLCFQIPALLRRGVGVVISPLIALMEDQVSALRELGVRAGFLNSSQDAGASADVQRALRAGELDLLYVSPERLLSPSFLDWLERVSSIALFAVDEAHCASQWGHDFRPEYQQLGIIHERFPDVPRIALTATADVPTRNEIRHLLGLDDARVFVSSFDRPNISYRIAEKGDTFARLLRFIREEYPDQAGIVYCATRDKVEENARLLTREGIRALPYHAGLSAEERRANQRTFVNEEGVVMTATIAFGMGIDKPNVRFVAHLDLPKSMESYYQETGRAGRDGLPATAWLAYGMQDIALIKQFIDSSSAPEERKRIEHGKLRSLCAFVETADCRRQVLLRYFGEEHPGSCGSCDNCVHPPERWDGTVAAQKALSCVYRTGQMFGAGHLTDVLTGKSNEKVTKFRHDQLSVFGVGAEIPKAEWLGIFRQLVASGYLSIDVERYGALSLSERAKEVLTGGAQVLLRRPVAKSGSRSMKSRTRPDGQMLAADARGLFSRLRAKRLALSKAQNVPPYVIFHDKTLMEMAERRPVSLEELRSISGVGEEKLRRYGSAFLDVLREEA